MTSDEIVFVGGLQYLNAPNTYYYLNSRGESVVGDKFWWTMSSSGFNGVAYVFEVNGSNLPSYMDNFYVHMLGVVRPVISLKREVVVSAGNGTSEKPYIVEL